MLLLRYQRQRTENAADECRAPDHEIRRKINDRDLKGESHRAATRGTLCCIFVCGSALLSLGVVIVCVGVLIPREDPTPWLVIGPTCIVLGVLVLLLSVEIIIKLRKISSSSGRSSTEREAALPAESELLKEPKGVPPVVLHPATPLQPLDASALEVVQHR